MLLLWIFSNLKSNARRSGTLFTSFVHQNIATLFPSVAWRSAGTQHMLKSYMPLTWNWCVVNMLDSFSPADVCCQALNQWIDSMDQSLLGKAKAAVKCCQKKWRLSPDDGNIGKVVRHLKVVAQSLNLFLELKACSNIEIPRHNPWVLTNKVPTISKVLPLFKTIQHHLEAALRDPDLTKDKSGQKYCGLKCGFKAGLNKINIHLEKALVGDYPLLGTGEFLIIHNLIDYWLVALSLTPMHSSCYFEDASKWMHQSQHMLVYCLNIFMMFTRQMAACQRWPLPK